MRFMLTFRILPERGDTLIKNGSIGQTLQSIMADLKPEAAYFCDIEGARGGYLVINMDDASQIPAITEPLSLGLGATITLHPVMTAEDVAKGTASLQALVEKYS